MENFEETKPELLESEEPVTLMVSEDIRSYIYDTAKWSRFLSVVGFIFSALIAISAFSVAAILGSLQASMPNNPLLQLGSGGITAIYLVIAFLQFYPSLLLFKFSSAANQAVLYGDQASLTAAMSKLKSFFKFFGVLTIAFIVFYIVTILLSIMMLASR